MCQALCSWKRRPRGDRICLKMRERGDEKEGWNSLLLSNYYVTNILLPHIVLLLAKIIVVANSFMVFFYVPGTVLKYFTCINPLSP